MALQRHFLRGLAVSAVLATSSLAQETTMETVVATVGDEEITVAHVMNVRRALPEQYQSIPDEQLFRGIVDQLVQRSVLAQSVDKAPSYLTSAIENEERNLLASYALQQMAEVEISEDQILAAYEENFGNTEAEREFNASHILVETEEEATVLISRLDEGEDFGELARSYSTGPSGPSGGALGWFGPGMMVKPFEDAVMAMNAGEVSAPVQTQFGWHVVRLNETRVIEAPGLDEVRSDLEEQLRSQAVNQAMGELMAGANPEITEGIDPSVLSTLEFSVD